MNQLTRLKINAPIIYSIQLVLFLLFICFNANSQITVFSDDFSDGNANYYTNGQQIGTSNWTITSVPDWGGRIFGDSLELSNDVSGTSNANGSVTANLSTSNFLAPYHNVLKNNPGLVTWTFNMKQVRPDPSGFNSSNYGVAFILATNGNTGYAVTLGESGSLDYLKLVKFTGGFPGTRTTLITGTDDIGIEHLSIKITYDPSNDQWTMSTRIDGGFFLNPTSGTTLQGSATDATYVNDNLNSLGAYWQGSTTAGQTAFFDNLGISVFCTNPTFTTSKADVGCFGGTNGSITVTTTLSNPQFSKDGGFTYTTVETSPYSFSGLTAGSYDILVKSGTCVAPLSTITINQ
ncbi:MAG TPA: hypothetical protein PLY70_08460, partial [Saprospiraceae bacterium]|nr:hypothetical protein [Saprospiraceae bacterium]